LQTFLFLFYSFRQFNSQIQSHMYDSAYQETQSSEKIPENQARRLIWSLSVTNSAQRYIHEDATG